MITASVPCMAMEWDGSKDRCHHTRRSLPVRLVATLVEDSEPMLLLLFFCSFGPASRIGRCNYIYSYMPCIPTYPLLPHHPTWVGWQEKPTHYSHPSYPESNPILHSILLPHPAPSYTGFYCHPTPSHHSLPWMLLPSYPVPPYPTPSYTVFYCQPTASYLW